MLKIDKVGYSYPNLVFSINDITFLLILKSGRGKKWLKWRMVYLVFAYPTIENDMKRTKKLPIRSIEKFVISVLSNFPTRSNNTNESAREFIWKWRQK
jgi:hypothetical protein